MYNSPCFFLGGDKPDLLKRTLRTSLLKPSERYRFCLSPSGPPRHHPDVTINFLFKIFILCYRFSYSVTQFVQYFKITPHRTEGPQYTFSRNCHSIVVHLTNKSEGWRWVGRNPESNESYLEIRAFPSARGVSDVKKTVQRLLKWLSCRVSAVQ